MGLLDYYRQFEGLSEEEVNARLRAEAQERKRTALERVPPLDLSSAAWHRPPHPDIVSAITFAARRALHIPRDPHASEVRAAIGSRHALEPQRVVAGNGAADLLASSLRALLGPGDEAVVRWPCYPLIPLTVRASGATPVPAPGTNEDLLAALTPRTRVVVLCNPNDPDGELIGADELSQLVREIPEQVTVVIDEALRDFVTSEPVDATLPLLDEHPRLLIVRSFSKAWALAGMRAGFGLGGTGVGELLHAVAPPQGISVLAEYGMLEALERSPREVAARRTQIAAERDRLVPLLREAGIDVPAGEANLLWLGAPALGPGELHSALARQGVMTLRGDEYGAPERVRASVRDEAAGNRLLSALKNCL